MNIWNGILTLSSHESAEQKNPQLHVEIRQTKAGFLQGRRNSPASPVSKDTHLSGFSIFFLHHLPIGDQSGSLKSHWVLVLAEVGARGTKQLPGLITIICSPEIQDPFLSSTSPLYRKFERLATRVCSLTIQLQSTNHFFSGGHCKTSESHLHNHRDLFWFFFH